MEATDLEEDVESWLKRLDLGQYVPTFHYNGLLYVKQCMNLTEEYLNHLGISQRGYQKRIISHLPKSDTMQRAVVGNIPDIPPRPPKPEARSTKPIIPPRPRPTSTFPSSKLPSFDDESYLLVAPGVGKRSSSFGSSVSLPKRPSSPGDGASAEQLSKEQPFSSQQDISIMKGEDDDFDNNLRSEKPQPLPRRRGRTIKPASRPVPPVPSSSPKSDLQEEKGKPSPKPRMKMQTSPSLDNSNFQRSSFLSESPPVPARPLENPFQPDAEGKVVEDVPLDKAKTNPFNPFVSDSDFTSEESVFMSNEIQPISRSRMSSSLISRPLPPAPALPDQPPRSPVKEPGGEIDRNSVDYSSLTPREEANSEDSFEENEEDIYRDDSKAGNESDGVKPSVVLVNRPVPLPPPVTSPSSSPPTFPPPPVLLSKEASEDILDMFYPMTSDSLNIKNPPFSVGHGVDSLTEKSTSDPSLQDDPFSEYGSVFPGRMELDSTDEIDQKERKTPEGGEDFPHPMSRDNVQIEGAGLSSHINPVTSQESMLDTPNVTYESYDGARNDSSSTDEYFDLAEAFSGRPAGKGNMSEEVHPPPARATPPDSNYFFLSDFTSGQESSTDSILIPSPDVKSKESQSHFPFDNDPTHLVPKQSPKKPARKAPPPPVRQASLTSPRRSPNTSPTKIPNTAYFGEDDVYCEVGSTPLPPMEVKQLQHSPTSSSHGFKVLAQSEESEDDDLENPSGFRNEGIYAQAEFVSSRPSDSTDNVVQPERNDDIRKSKRQIRKSMHARTVQKVSETLQRLSRSGQELQVKKLEKCGYLFKQSGNGGYRKRYVVFNGAELRYYTSEKEMQSSKGIIPVGTMTDVKFDGNGKTGDKSNRIELSTNSRTFHFASESLDDGVLWANTLMQGIISYVPPPGGFPLGGDISSPDKAGYLKMDGAGSKRYVAIKGEILCVYNTIQDFEAAIPICDIEMKLANAKINANSKSKIQLTTPSKTYFFTADSFNEATEWKNAMDEAILEGLSDHKFLEQVWENESNKYCAECATKDPDWASINLGIVICKQCSGVHRNLGVHISKVRSLKMDTKAWTPDLMEMMIGIGNNNSNAYWEYQLNEDDDDKPSPADMVDHRQKFIEMKYKQKKYCEVPLLSQSEINEKLLRAVSNESVQDCIKLIFSGADPTYKSQGAVSAFEIAKSSKQYAKILEFFNQNYDQDFHPVVNQARSGLHSTPAPSLPPTHKPLPPKPPTRINKQEEIKKSGHLFKTGSNRRDFQKRYCILEHGVFRYFENERAQIEKNKIESRDMILIAQVEPKSNQRFCFDLCTTSGRAYLFAAESDDERQEWLAVLAQPHCLEEMWKYLDDYNYGGFLKKKEGAATVQWQRLFFLLKNHNLYYFSVQSETVESIDLRKLTSLSLDESNESGETTNMISLVLPKRNVYLKPETSHACDYWYQAFQKQFDCVGKSLEEQPLSGDNVPLIIEESISYVIALEGYTTVGLYRLSGAAQSIRKIVERYSTTPRNLNLNDEEANFQVHDITGAMKKYLRELPEPLLTTELYCQWTDIAGYEDYSTRMQWYKHLLNQLPTVNYCTLKKLLDHLIRVGKKSEVNSMHMTNIATVFGPTLMASSDPNQSSFQNAEREIRVIEELAHGYCWLFDVDESVFLVDQERQKKIDDAMKAMQDANLRPPVVPKALDLIVEVHIGRKEEGRVFNVRLTNESTAKDLITNVVQNHKLREANWAAFEIVCNGDLERMFHFYEMVLPNVLKWSKMFPTTANYICIMEDYISPRIDLCMKALSSTGFLKYSEGKKSFKKYYFELNNNKLTYSKDKDSQVLKEWKVMEMRIYLGYEKKKSTPSKYGLTFYLENEQPSVQRVLCFENDSDMNQWLGALFKSKDVEPSSISYPALQFSPVFSRVHKEDIHDPKHKRITQEFSRLTSKLTPKRKSRFQSIEGTPGSYHLHQDN